MSKSIPKQILPVIDPDQSDDTVIYTYYLLEKPESPSVTPPNAKEVVQYKRRQFLHDDPDDFRRPYGYAVYGRELTYEEIDEYNLLPFEPVQILLFDLWKSFEKDKAKMVVFFTNLFKVLQDDPHQARLKGATKLINMDYSLRKIKAAIKGIK